MQIKKHFRSKKIVYSKNVAPGELVKVFMHKGKKYVRIAITNRVKFKGMMPVTDVLFSNVTGIRKVPSPFKKKCFGLIGMKPKAVYYQLRK